MESVINISECTDGQKVKFVSACFKSHALTWWNTLVQARGVEGASNMSWGTFKELMSEEFRPDVEVARLEKEMWELQMVGSNHVGYTNRFHELARLVPRLVTPEKEMIKRYVYGLEEKVRGALSAHTLVSMKEAIEKSAAVTENLKRSGALGKSGEKRKESVGTSNGGRFKKGKNFAATANAGQKMIGGPPPQCVRCNGRHPTTQYCDKCGKCGRLGHKTMNCRDTGGRVAPRLGAPRDAGYPQRQRGECFECGAKDHYRNTCPRLNLQQAIVPMSRQLEKELLY